MKDRNEIMRFFGLHPQNDVRRKFAFTFAEGATHVDNSNNKRRFAFTLAEILITLGIIGVVAALTIPNLIQNYQKKQWVSGLQKGYATLNQVFKTAMAEDLVDDVTQTELWGSIPINEGGYQDFERSELDYSPFIEQLKKYLKVTKFCNPTSDPLNDPCFGISYLNLDGNDNDDSYTKASRLKIYTADGMVFYFHGLAYDGYTEFFYGAIEVDVNGDAEPNQMGRDTFSFAFLKNGTILLPGTKSWTETYSVVHGAETLHWSDENSSSHCLLNKQNGMAHIGDYCAARIFESGWKMDY